MTIHIYGLFNWLNRIEYIGATQKPQTRAKKHLSTHGGRLTFRVLKKVKSTKAANKIERDLIWKCWRRGEAALNQVDSGYPLRRKTINQSRARDMANLAKWPARTIHEGISDLLEY